MTQTIRLHLSFQGGFTKDTSHLECLDHLLVVSRRHLEQVLAEYVRHYNEAGPHRGLQLAQPIPRPGTGIASGTVVRFDVLGGIIREYERAA
jgi:hypothetical protein